MHVQVHAARGIEALDHRAQEGQLVALVDFVPQFIANQFIVIDREIATWLSWRTSSDPMACMPMVVDRTQPPYSSQ